MTVTRSAPNSSRAARAGWWVGVLCALAACLLPVPEAWAEGWSGLVLNGLHWPFCLVVTLVCLVQFRVSSCNGRWLVALTVTFVGYLFEGMQSFTGRSFDGHDILLNAMGAFSGSMLHGAWRGGGRGIISSSPLVLLAIAGAWPALHPFLDRLNLERAQVEIFPALDGWEHDILEQAWQARPLSRDAGSGRLAKMSQRWSSLRREGFGQSWAAYEGLTIEYENPGSEVLEVGVRVDGGRQGVTGRLNGSLKLLPGRHRMMLPFTQMSLREAGDTREAVLARVERLVLFFPDTRGDGEVFLRGVRLFGSAG